MAEDSHPTLFRSGLLEGASVVVCGPSTAAARACATLGARVALCDAGPGTAEVAATVGEACTGVDADPLDEEQVAAALAQLVERQGGIDTLVVDGAARFAAAGGAGISRMRAATDATWIATRAAAGAAMISKPEGGKVVVIAPASGAGPHAGAARAALENLARTLSIEWSRYEIRVTTILPGDATTPEEIGAVVAFLASTAGDYYSGCALELGGAALSRG